jgi:hypothetical protein
VLDVAKRFLEDTTLQNDAILYQKTLREVKMEVALIVHDSPYAEVSRVVQLTLHWHSPLLNLQRFVQLSLPKMIQPCRAAPFEPGRSGYFLPAPVV